MTTRSESTTVRRLVGASLLAFLSLGALPLAAQTVTNVRATQLPDKTVEVLYDLSGAAPGGAQVTVAFSSDGGGTYTISPATSALSGNVGASVPNGTNRRIVWNAAVTLPAQAYGTNYRAAVTAANPSSGEPEVTYTLPGGVPLVMVKVRAGTFQMGAPETERGSRNEERPVHRVTLTQDYYIGKFEVTQKQWHAVMGTNPSNFNACGGDCPVEQVSWDDIRGTNGFIAKLNQQLGTTRFRLPTEAEWERAARGGGWQRFSFGDALGGDDECKANAEADPYAWWCGNAEGATHLVGRKQPNSYGLFDMHGNVWEWVEDWSGSYSITEQVDPKGPPSGTSRVQRGGGWVGALRYARSASRGMARPGDRSNGVGFRLFGLAISAASETAYSNVFPIDLRPAQCTVACEATVPATGTVGTAVAFQGSATASGCSGSPSYTWQFGDGATSTQQNPSHTFTGAGTYSWRLTTSVGSSTCTRTGQITISASPTCTLACSATVPAAGTVGTAVAFKASATPSSCSGSPSFSWQFGDGTTSAQQNPSRTYATVGTYGWSMTASIGGVACSRSGKIAIAVADGDLVTETRVIPIVLDSAGAGGAHYTTELVLTNRGSRPAFVTYRYEASLGTRQGSGAAGEALAAGGQKVIPNAIEHLRALGLGIPAPGPTSAQGGALFVKFSGASDDVVSAVARTTTATVAPQPVGAAGLSYAGLPPYSVPDGATNILHGLRQDATDRSNVAVFNVSPDPVTVRVTAFSGDGSGYSRVVKDETLGGFGWVQYSSVFANTGITQGWVWVEKTGGAGNYSAYGVINDNGTSDGSFVLPMTGKFSGSQLTVPVLVESSTFRSELVLANRSGSDVSLSLSYVESASPQYGPGGTATVTLRPREQRIIPDAIEFLRRNGVQVGTMGVSTYVGTLRVTVSGAVLSDVYAGARTASLSPAGGQFGLFTPCVYAGQEATTEAFLYGLRADSENRSNVAVLNAGASGQGSVTLEIRTYDGDAGGVERGAPEYATLGPGQWKQYTNFLKDRGIRNGWVKATRTAGAAPWIVYGVVNDGANPGERTGDGAYVPMTALASGGSGGPTTCTSFSISPASASPGSTAGSQAVTVTGLPAGCEGGSWSAAGNGSWLSVTPAGGTGSGSVSVSWTANTTPASRSGSVTIAGNAFSVTQAGATGGGNEEVTFTLPGGVPLVMVKIPKGTFQMGSPETERGRESDETLHTVTLTQDYYIGKYEVTQAQWQAVMGSNPSSFNSCGGDCPVEQVSWDDIHGPNGFIAKLNQLLGTTKFRLPTEAEWERAARGGTQTRFSFGDALDGSDDCGTNAAADPYVWWCGNSGGKTHAVGTKKASPYGLYDMHGNVFEWVEDWYGGYPTTAQTNPTGPAMGTNRVYRGSSWGSSLLYARSAYRNYFVPSLRIPGVGFRLASSAEENEITYTLPGGVPLVMVKIPKGTFQMGSPTTERSRISDETPHQVTLTSDYYIGKYEVTQAQWQAVMGSNPSEHISCGSNCPVETVSWDDIHGPNGFIAKLNQLLGTTKFRLPTEAEWERAARAGTQTRFSFGDALGGDDGCGPNAEADPYVWWCGNNVESKTHTVGTKGANPYGLFDMHGNVSEMVEDWFGSYPPTAQTNPTGPATASNRVNRGGSFGSSLYYSRSAVRHGIDPAGVGGWCGFRLASSAEENEITYTLPGGVPLVLVKIPAGTFKMGAPASERNSRTNEQPVHEVTLSEYYIGKSEVTQAQWQAVMGSNPSRFTSCGGDCPVEMVSWNDIRGAGGFIATLNQLLGTTKFRLPTEAEWEQAARGGEETRFSFGDALTGTDNCGSNADAEQSVWWCANSGGTTHPVNSKASNPYGLFGVHGNVGEFVEDWSGPYPSTAQTNPSGPSTGMYRVVRGGDYLNDLLFARSACRNGGVFDTPDHRSYTRGFRLARSR